MKLTVAVITYNQAPFIRQTLDNVFAQQHAMEWEVLVGEDDSSDGTREIVRGIGDQHPGLMRVRLGSRKDIVFIGGKPTGRRNFIETIKSCSGEYIAYCEGDDYWISPDKLRRQAEMLDSNPSLSMVATDAWLEHDGERTLFSSLFIKKKAASYTLNDLLNGDFMPPTCSVMFRRSLLEFPDWLWGTPVGDVPLFALSARHGPIGWIDEPLAVYRIQPGGIFSKGKIPKGLQTSVKNARVHMQAVIGMYENIRLEIGSAFRADATRRIAQMHRDTAWLARSEGNAALMRRHAWQSLCESPRHHTVELVRLILRSALPLSVVETTAAAS